MSDSHVELPVPVRDFPHWRVNVRPSEHAPNRIPTLKRCVELIEHNTVRFRGWDYPHWGEQLGDAQYGDNWIASWADFMSHKEYWRLFQSGQFIHLFAVREFTDEVWDRQLRQTLAAQLGGRKDKGFFDLVNTVHTVAEITEFATRMAQSEVLAPSLSLSIAIVGIRGFVVTTDWSRGFLRQRYIAKQDTISHTWHHTSEQLVADSVTPTVEVCKWIFERFGWLDISEEMLRRDVVEFKQGRV